MAIKGTLLIGLGFLFLGLGAVGLLLPVWPTTPFVLVAAGCFVHAPRMRAWIMKSPLFGEYVNSYEARTGLSRKTVVASLCWLWGMLVLSMVLTRRLWLVLLLTAIGAAVTVHILHIARDRRGRKEENE